MVQILCLFLLASSIACTKDEAVVEEPCPCFEFEEEAVDEVLYPPMEPESAVDMEAEEVCRGGSYSVVHQDSIEDYKDLDVEIVNRDYWWTIVCHKE